VHLDAVLVDDRRELRVGEQELVSGRRDVDVVGQLTGDEGRVLRDREQNARGIFGASFDIASSDSSSKLWTTTRELCASPVSSSLCLRSTRTSSGSSFPSYSEGALVSRWKRDRGAVRR
jgi:hypothetical protein